MAAKPPVQWNTYADQVAPKDRSGLLYKLIRAVPLHTIDFLRSLPLSIWLFTRSDIKTIIAPSFVFGVLNALSIRSFGLDGALPADIFCRCPFSLLWIWINLLPFNIDNQRRPESIEEDRTNKPWRTLPSCRMSPQQAFALMAVLYPLAVLFSFVHGGLRQCLSLIVLGWSYNSLSGSETVLSRNLINALGFICFSSGALEVSVGSALPLNFSLCGWFATIGVVVFTTVQTQDMYDQEGDRKRGRLTLPIWLGDSAARWTIIIPMCFWCILCPYFWQSNILGYLISTALGSSISIRSHLFREVEHDKATFKLWNVWMMLVYSIPALKAVGIF